MTRLSLRLRIFLFFCLLAAASAAATLGGLWLGYRQLGVPDALSAFVTSGIVALLGITGVSVLIWLLFDEHVSKPIQSLAAHLRVRTHADVDTDIAPDAARYLGDLAPAAAAIQAKLTSTSQDVAETVAQKTARLERETQQLLQILSDLPIAVIVARADHQVVLYDGQAAALMEVEAPALLGGQVFDYFRPEAICDALRDLEAAEGQRLPIALTGHSGAIYTGHIRSFGAGSGYTLMVEQLDTTAERPLTYDFDLLDSAPDTGLEQTLLRDLAFVVFDSETTGLDPASDAVVQLGAVRIVNGHIVEGEMFETLVKPHIPIPASATRVHGISEEMVAEAPAFPQACAAFHRFARGAVIVAHNAPFDMAFLRRVAPEAGVSFDAPVLDTVHISAAVFGGAAEHTLDAICTRLDITIPPELRHTAMGDAVATAKALVAMLPVLEARGIQTFGELQIEAHKHRRILKLDKGGTSASA